MHYNKKNSDTSVLEVPSILEGGNDTFNLASFDEETFSHTSLDLN